VSPDVHVFVLWSAALPQTATIVADLRQKFELLDARRITWAPQRFAENLRRFYGFELPERADKVSGSGAGPFIVYVVRDPAPVYELRARSRGIASANVHVYDSKQLYREWTGGGFRVHATNAADDAARDVFLLLGRTLESYAAAPSITWDGDPVPWTADVVGADGWASRDQLLTALALTSGGVLEAESDRALTVRVDDARRARQVAGGRRLRIGGDETRLRLRAPRRLPRPTVAASVRFLKRRTPRVARALAAVFRPVRRRRLEMARRRATIHEKSSRSDDESS
jgi:hypothetical protein